MLIARPRRAGDKILMGGINRSLKKLMCDKKIPVEIRSRLPIICDSDGIIAVPFIGVSDRAKPIDNSERTTLQFYLY